MVKDIFIGIIAGDEEVKQKQTGQADKSRKASVAPARQGEKPGIPQCGQ